MKKFFGSIAIGFFLLLSRSQAFAVDQISDSALTACPAEDIPAVNISNIGGRGTYPFSSERPTVYSQLPNTTTGSLGMNQACTNVSSNISACVNSNTLRFNYQNPPCPTNYLNDSDGCHLDIPVSSTTTPQLAPGTYFVHDLAGCWQSQTITVDQGCAVKGSLSCQDGSGQNLTTTCNGSTNSITIPSPPPPATQDVLLQNAVPVAGQTCAEQISTPLQLQNDFCVSGGSSGTFQVVPKSVKVPFAQDIGQYLTGILDWEHFNPVQLDDVYDRVLGLPGVTVPGGRIGFPGSQGISASWDYAGPVERLTPQLEQDHLKHQFLGWLCEANGTSFQGRVPKSLNTRYFGGGTQPWILEAPVLGSQIIASLIPNATQKFVSLCEDFPLPAGFPPIATYCQNLATFVTAIVAFDPDPIKINTCELYTSNAKWPDPPFINFLRKLPGVISNNLPIPPTVPLQDVYVAKMKSQCRNPDGTLISLCTPSAMYHPNFIEQAVWDRVPLFANEEGKGELTFQVCNSTQYVKVPFAVPQMLRLASASAYLQQMLLSSTDNQKNQQALNFVSGPTPPDNTCLNCQDAQNGPPDTEAFLDYFLGYNDPGRGTVSYQGGGVTAQSTNNTITPRTSIPFLLNAWYQTAGGPFGIFNIFRAYRSSQIITGLFQPSGKPFSGDSTFLDTPGSSLVQYTGANIKPGTWQLIYSKLAGIWNAKNWIMQSVAPY